MVSKGTVFSMAGKIRVATNGRVMTSIEKEKENDMYKVSFMVEKNGKTSRSTYKGKSSEVMAYMNAFMDMNKIE